MTVVAAAASISTDETRTSVLLRPRNFQWCWNSVTNPWSGIEQWQNYTNIENEIIEDAFTNKRDTVEINSGYIVDLKHQIQYNKTDENRQCSIKRYDLKEGCSNIHLREELFSTPVTLASSFGSSDQTNQEGLPEGHFPWAYYEQEVKDNYDTIANIVYDAAQGILKEGAALGKEADAQWMAQKLLDVKRSGEYIEAAFWPLKIPSEIGNVCVNLYTANKFWYQRINCVLQHLGTVTKEQIKSLGPFCYLLHYYLKDNMATENISEVYRGLTLNDTQRQEYMKDFIRFTSFTSTTKNREVAEIFSGDTLLIIDLNVSVFGRKIKCGVDISGLSAFPDEEEFLIWPTAIFEFVKYEYDSNKNKHVLYLKSSVWNE